ncbi:MAG: sialidase family protein, partial [Bryobacteraceae bacterium]
MWSESIRMNRTLSVLILAALAPMAAAAAEPERQDLFEGNKGGYFTYRIPGIVITGKGVILAYAEARKTDGNDWDNIDVVLRRSADGGRTFTPPAVIVNGDGKAANNPVMIPDSQTGDVHFLHCIHYGRCFYLRSGDQGSSFSPPVEITAVFEKYRPQYQWTAIATGPGHGIQLRSGRLLVPVWLSNGGGHNHRPSVVSSIYSDDHGKTWNRGEIVADAPLNPSEAVAVELADGRVMLNIRSEAAEHRRAVSYSKDGAHGWTRPAFVPDLLEPVCFGSIVRLTRKPQDSRNRILFANPDNLYSSESKREVVGASTWTAHADRKNLTIKMSYDEGATWPVSKVLVPGMSGYSDLAVAADKSIYCLHERGERIDNMFRP